MTEEKCILSFRHTNMCVLCIHFISITWVAMVVLVCLCIPHPKHIVTVATLLMLRWWTLKKLKGSNLQSCYGTFMLIILVCASYRHVVFVFVCFGVKKVLQYLRMEGVNECICWKHFSVALWHQLCFHLKIGLSSY